MRGNDAKPPPLSAPYIPHREPAGRKMSTGDKRATGFDDQFNDGLFYTGHHNSVTARPSKWPKSTSEMGVHTSYVEQVEPQTGDYNDGLFRVGAHNSALTRPTMWPKSVSEMRGHTSYSQQGLAADAHDVARNAYLDKRAQAGRWVYNPQKQGWVWVR